MREILNEYRASEKGDHMDEMTSKEFKTVLEMVIMIIEAASTKEEAVEKLKSLDILKND